jgi:hypothetical protein
MREIFLSASVPLKGRKYFKGSDPVLIHAAVRSFAMLALGRRHIVWGGHPTITPMLWAACESVGVEYAKWVTLYQSMYFRDDFPKANAHFRNVQFIDKKKSRAASLLTMRSTMLRRPGIEAAVFIGGMEGIVAEYRLLQELKPTAQVVFVGAPGGAARILAQNRRHETDLLSTNFTKLLSERLRIDPADKRDGQLGEGL